MYSLVFLIVANTSLLAYLCKVKKKSSLEKNYSENGYTTDQQGRAGIFETFSFKYLSV